MQINKRFCPNCQAIMNSDISLYNTLKTSDKGSPIYKCTKCDCEFSRDNEVLNAVEVSLEFERWVVINETEIVFDFDSKSIVNDTINDKYYIHIPNQNLEDCKMFGVPSNMSDKEILELWDT